MAASAEQWLGGATRLLICSAGGTATDWCASGVEGTAVELPGHGDAPRQPGWTPVSVAKEVAATTRGPVDVVGAGIGATVALELVLEHPELVRSAVLLCPDPTVLADVDRSAAAERWSNLERVATTGGMLAVTTSVLPAWFTPWARRTRAVGVARAEMALASCDILGFADTCAAARATTPIETARLQSVTKPITIVAGYLDEVAGLATAAALHDAVPRSRLEIWPAPHAIHLAHPEYVRATLDRHSIWAASGNRVEAPLGCSVWRADVDEPWEGIA